MTIAEVEQTTQSSEALESMASVSRKVGIPKEVYPGEQRVAATPDTAKVLQKMGFEVWVEPGAGDRANFSDDLYKQAGCHICSDAKQLWAIADIVLKVRAPQHHPELGVHEAELTHSGQTLISFIWPAQNAELLEQLATQKATVLAMDSVPRITRAQKMDALSSTANLAGYRAVIEAAHQFGRFLPDKLPQPEKSPPPK